MTEAQGPPPAEGPPPAQGSPPAQGPPAAQGPPPAPAPDEKRDERIVIVQQQPPQKKRSIVRSVITYLVVAVVVLSFLLNFVLLQWLAVLMGPTDGPRETYIEGSTRSEHKVAIVSIAGMMSAGSDSPMSGRSMVADVLAQLKRAREDEKVIAVVLEVNSPGGTVNASDILLHEIERTKAAGKRIVVWMGGLAASGGYYVSCRADRIYASPTTMTGSIGVVWPLFNVKGLAEKVGIKYVPITRGDLKEMGSPFHEMTPKERARFEMLADEAYQSFKALVKEGRGLTAQEANRVADGSIMTASEARELKLVDEIGYLEAAVDDARGDREDVAVVRYKKTVTLFSALLSSEAKPPSGDLRVVVDSPLPRLDPGLHYIWLPGVPVR